MGGPLSGALFWNAVLEDWRKYDDGYNVYLDEGSATAAPHTNSTTVGSASLHQPPPRPPPPPESQQWSPSPAAAIEGANTNNTNGSGNSYGSAETISTSDGNNHDGGGMGGGSGGGNRRLKMARTFITPATVDGNPDKAQGGGRPHSLMSHATTTGTSYSRSDDFSASAAIVALSQGGRPIMGRIYGASAASHLQMMMLDATRAADYGKQLQPVAADASGTPPRRSLLQLQEELDPFRRGAARAVCAEDAARWWRPSWDPYAAQDLSSLEAAASSQSLLQVIEQGAKAVRGW